MTRMDKFLFVVAQRPTEMTFVESFFRRSNIELGKNITVVLDMRKLAEYKCMT